MICLKCDHENKDDYNFCEKCGKKLIKYTDPNEIALLGTIISATKYNFILGRDDILIIKNKKNQIICKQPLENAQIFFTIFCDNIYAGGIL